MYKVFINGNVLFIAEKPAKHVPGFKKVSVVFFEKSDPFEKIIRLFENHVGEKLCYYVIGNDVPLMWRKFRKHYQLVLAGGGLVRNGKNKILFIFRNGKWDLPKGKAEPNEDIETTALREVQEECGIKNLIIIRHLTDTYHTYGSPLNRKLKKTVWFRMYSEDKNLVPQVKEGITKIKWKKEHKLEKILANTYPSIVDVIRAELAIQPLANERKWHSMTNFE